MMPEILPSNQCLTTQELVTSIPLESSDNELQLTKSESNTHRPRREIATIIIAQLLSFILVGLVRSRISSGIIAKAD